MNPTGLHLDLKVYEANDRNTKNILSNRAGFTQENAFTDIRNFSLDMNKSVQLLDVENTICFVLYSTLAVNVMLNVGSSMTPSTFENQTMMVLSGEVSSIQIDNNNSKIASIQVIRFAISDVAPTMRIPRQLVSFDTLSRITQLPQAITDHTKFTVQNITLFDWIEDQSTAPGTGSPVLNKYRICDSNGTANLNGSYIMILNDDISQQNFSGTLELWIAETF